MRLDNGKKDVLNPFAVFTQLWNNSFYRGCRARQTTHNQTPHFNDSVQFMKKGNVFTDSAATKLNF